CEKLGAGAGEDGVMYAGLQLRVRIGPLRALLGLSEVADLGDRGRGPVVTAGSFDAVVEPHLLRGRLGPPKEPAALLVLAWLAVGNEPGGKILDRTGEVGTRVGEHHRLAPVHRQRHGPVARQV